MEQEGKVANIDLDGTAANFNKAVLRDLNAIRSPDEPEFTSEHLRHPPDWLEARLSLIKKQPGFWRNLEEIPLGMRVIELIRGAKFKLNVLTKGPKRTTSAWTEKAEWSAEHIPDANVTITMSKGLVYGRVLMDDWPSYITEWLEHRPRGLVLMLDHSWNQGFEHPNVVRIRGEEDFPEVMRRLAEAASR